MTYPQTAGAKERGGTSEEAAGFVEKNGRAATLRRRCKDMLTVFGGLTADEVAAKLGEDILSVRPRMSELFASGDVEKTGDRRKNANGKSQCVYRLNNTTPQLELL